MLRTILKEQTVNIIHQHFQELSRKQLEICLLHTLGMSKKKIAQIYSISVDAVKQNIQRSVHKLELENSDALRSAILVLTFTIMINK